MFSFTYRNLILFFKDRAAVLLSFLSDTIIILLYFLFLRDNLLSHFPNLPKAELLMDIWMMAGLLGITSFSVSIGVYSRLVEDRCKRIDKDLYITPLPRITYLGGYFSCAVIISFLYAFLLLLICESYFWLRYNTLPGSESIWTVYGLLCLVSFTGSSLALLFVSFIKTSHVLNSCCTILGALIGFLTGIYLPIGNIPESVEILILCFPVSHGVMLFRQLLMESYLLDVFSHTITDQAEFFFQYMGIQFTYNNQIITNKSSVIILLITTLLSFCLAAIIDNYIFLRNPGSD